MIIHVKSEEFSQHDSLYTGGEYADCDLTIHIDRKLPIRKRHELATHAVIENYFPAIPHTSVEEVTRLICQAIDLCDELDKLNNPDS